MKNKLKLLSLIMIIAVSAAFLPACSQSQNDQSQTEQSQASESQTDQSQDGQSQAQTAPISSPALVSKVTKYMIDYSSEDLPWIDQATFEYEYKDGYPVLYTRTEGGEATPMEFKYEFANGKPVRMTRNSESGETVLKTSYNKKGLVNRVKTYENSGRKIGEQVFQYGNRDEYFTMVLHENIISPADEPVTDHMEETDSVIITAENGLLRKTVNDGLFANYNDKEEKIWRRFDGSYTAVYDENGILSETSAIFKSFPGSGKQNKVDLTIEDGRVTEAILSNWIPDGDSGTWEPDSKFVFEYSSEEISPARYASMINYFLLEGGGNYYIYNWY